MERYPILAEMGTRSLARLEAFLEQHRGGGCSIEEFERGLRQELSGFESEVLGKQLAELDEAAAEIEVEGRIYRRKHRSSETYFGLGGAMRVERNVYVPRGGGGRAICPLELRAGIVAGKWTPGAARVMAKSVALMTPGEASDLLGEIGGLTPSTSSLDRVPKALSSKWEGRREEFEGELRESEVIPARARTLAVSIDGVQTPMKDTGRAEKRSQEGKLPKGPAGFREVGCGTVSLYDGGGERLETKKWARMPESKKATVKSQVLAEAKAILASAPDLEVVFLSDGAQDHWEFAEDLSRELGGAEVHLVLDLYHVLERLMGTLVAIYGEGSAKAKGTFEEWRQLLLEEPGAVETILRGLRYRRGKSAGPVRKVIEGTVRYLEKRRGYMRYAELVSRNLPVGSGVVEAACKTLVTQRMKRSGMSWRAAGGQAVLTLRSLIQSGRWEAGWEKMAGEYRKEIIPIHRRAA